MTSWTPIGGTTSILGHVAATSRSSDQIDLFVRKDDGGETELPTPVCTRARYQSTWWPQSDWYCFTDFVTKESPAAVSSGANALYVFGVQADGSVWWRRWGNLVGWQAPVSLGTVTRTDDPVAVVSRSNGYWDAFMRDRATGQICTKAWANGVYWPSQTGAWSCFGTGSVIKGPPVAVSAGANALDVFGIFGPEDESFFNSGQVLRAFWRGANWQLELHGGQVTSIAAVSRASGLLDLFVTDVSGQVKTQWYNGSTWGPSPAGTGWYNLGGDGIDVSAVTSATNHLDVTVRYRNDNAVRHRFWYGSGWLP